MADSRYFKNRKIAVSHDNAERVFQAYQLSTILDFIYLFFNSMCTWETRFAILRRYERTTGV